MKKIISIQEVFEQSIWKKLDEVFLKGGEPFWVGFGATEIEDEDPIRPDAS